MVTLPAPTDPPTVTATTPAAVPVHDTATVVLLRESGTRLEVLLTRRAAQMSFMGDLWVFPGGRLDALDCSPDLLTRVPAAQRDAVAGRLRSLSGDTLDAGTSLGLHVAGCRETFEECGVLLAWRADGTPCSTEQVDRLQHHRAGMAKHSAAFLTALRDEDLYLDLSRLVYWAHWITPSFERKRFDTRFFAMEVPAGQEPRVDLSETTEHAWLTVDEAFAQYAAGAMKFAPPTLATLKDLHVGHAAHGSLAAMLANERGRDVPPILPKWFEADGKVTIVLPWDPEYSTMPGESARTPARYPDYLAALPSRRSMGDRSGRGR